MLYEVITQGTRRGRGRVRRARTQVPAADTAPRLRLLQGRRRGGGLRPGRVRQGLRRASGVQGALELLDLADAHRL